MDIFSDAVSHFTDIPQEFIKKYINNLSRTNGKNGLLFDYIMDIDFPEIEALILLNDLKSGDLDSTIDFFNNSFEIIREEESRQAIAN